MTFDKHGGRITNDATGNAIPIYRSNGVFKMKAELTDPMQGHQPIMSIDTDTAGHPLDTESQEAKAITHPKKPSPEEVTAHELTHLPYRSWCSHCVRGRGRADDHHHVEEAREIPLVSTDYLFLGDESEGKLTVMTVYDSASGMTFGNPCRRKVPATRMLSEPWPATSRSWATASSDCGRTRSRPFWP